MEKNEKKKVMNRGSILREEIPEKHMKNEQLKFKMTKTISAKNRSLTGLFFLLHTHLGNYSLFTNKNSNALSVHPFLNFKGMYAKSIDVKH